MAAVPEHVDSEKQREQSSNVRPPFSPQASLSRAFTWVLEEIRWTLRVVVSSADRFYWDNGFSRAASLAYTTLFALVPLTVLAFGLLGSFALSKEHLPQVRDFIFQQFVPQIGFSTQVLEKITEFSESLSSLNLLAITFVVVTTILLINSIESTLNAVWQVYESRNISHRVGIFSAIIVIAPVLAVSAYYFTRFRFDSFISDNGIFEYVNYVYTALLPFLIDFVAFFSLYYLVPKAPVWIRSATFGGCLAAILFGLGKGLFANYIERFSSYGQIYGALAAIPVFLFWLYLAWSVVLFGAEISYQAQYLPRRGKLWKRTVISMGDGRLLLGLQSILSIARAFEEGRRLPSDLELAEQLGCSSVLLKPALDALERRSIIQRGESRSMPLTLMRAPDKITLEEVQEALFPIPVAVQYPAEIATVFAAFRDGRDPRGVTLTEIMRNRSAVQSVATE